MSGGVGPTSGNSTLPKEQHHPLNPAGKPTTTHRKSTISLKFRHLIALALMIILSTSGMVSIADISFVIFSFIYVYFLSKTAFPLQPQQQQQTTPKQPFFRNRIFNYYFAFTVVMGLFLPILYILHGVFEGDKIGIKAASPHLFLLASQVLMEGVTFNGRFSMPIWVFVPVFYNTKRIFTIVEWVRSEMEKKGDGERRIILYVGRGLALANLALWSYNLFGFLVPVFLPKVFKIYYGGSSTNNKVKV